MSQPPETQSEAAAQMKKIESQLRLMTKVFMDGVDPIVIRDLEGRVLDMNHEVARVFGWNREEMIGQRTKHLLAPECQQAAEEIHERRLKGEKVRNFEAIVRAKSGRLVPVLATVFLLTDEHGEPVGMADILKDVTLLRQACDQVKQRNRDLQQFSKTASLMTWPHRSERSAGSARFCCRTTKVNLTTKAESSVERSSTVLTACTR